MRLLFLHHSVGRYFFTKGNLRERVAATSPAVEIWDHDYNDIGLKSPSESLPALPLPDDDTDPDALRTLFTHLAEDSNYLGGKLSQYDGFIAKSCYPNSHVRSDEQLNNLKDTYKAIDAAATTIGKPVIIVTSPPLVRERTSRAAADRARVLHSWMARPDSLPNLTVVDCFGQLSARSGVLRNTLALKYRKPWPFDSHPNDAGSTAVAELIASAIAASVRT